MNRFISLILISFCATATLSAQSSEAEFILLQKDYVLHADGSSDLTCRQVVKYLTHYSFNSLYGETFIVYDPRYQSLEIKECYTIQADRTRIEAPFNAFNEVLPRFAADAPAHNHLREMVVTHTGLEIGATAYLEYTLHTKAGYHPEFDQVLALQESSPIKEYRVSVSLPEAKKLQYRNHGITLSPKISRRAGIQRYEWTFRSLSATSKDAYQPADGSNVPRLLLSTWASQEAALQWLAAQQSRESIALPVSKPTEVYDYIINRIAYTPVPLAHTGYNFREPSQVFQTASGTAIEKAALMLAVAYNMGVPARLVAIYPTYMNDTSFGSLAAIESFAVAISIGQGNYFLTSMTDFQPVSLDQSRPGFLYVSVERPPQNFVAKLQNQATLSANIQLGSQSFSGKLSVNGAFYPLLSLMDSENNALGLLSGVRASAKDGVQADNEHFSLTLTAKTAARENQGYHSLLLPEVRGGANNWNMRNLTSQRPCWLEIPYPVNESYTYTVTAPQGAQFVNPPMQLQREYSIGKVSLLCEPQTDGSLKITRQLQIHKNWIAPADYAKFAELMKIWGTENCRTVVWK